MADSLDLAIGRRAIRVGLLGAGRAAVQYHVPALKNMEGLFTVAAICDTLKERRDSLVKDFPNAQLYRKDADLFEDPEVELVLVATPTTFHEGQIREALAHGKWVVCESPIALSHDAAALMKASSQKSRGRLLPCADGLFSPELQLARMFRHDPRLGDVFAVRVARSDYIRRDDWQTVMRCGGGAVWYAAPDAMLQLMSLLEAQPNNLWSDLKRIAGMGDAEDFVQLCIKTREGVTGVVDISFGRIPPFPPEIEIFGSRGVFKAYRGSKDGVLHVIDPDKTFQRRRSSVRTPGFEDRHEEFDMVDIPVSLPDDAAFGAEAFWRAVYKTTRIAEEFPVRIDDAVEAVKYLQLAKKSSPFQ